MQAGIGRSLPALHCVVFFRQEELHTTADSMMGSPQLGGAVKHQPGAESSISDSSPLYFLWAKVQAMLSHSQLPDLSSWGFLTHCKADTQTDNARRITQPAAEIAQLQSASPLCSVSEAHDGLAHSCSSVHQAQSSMHAWASQQSLQARLDRLPWPRLHCTRKSALRWQVHWHGLPWSARKHRALELQLDQCY